MAMPGSKQHYIGDRQVGNLHVNCQHF